MATASEQFPDLQKPTREPQHGRHALLVATARRLRLEAATVELVGALEGAGIMPLLLKGETVAAWLYRPFGQRREYQDVDLLVAPADYDCAGDVLERLGYARDFDDRDMPSWWREHAVAWVRGDGTTVDLHRRLVGIGADPAAAWESLARDAEPVEVRGQRVPALALPARALHVALHAAQHGPAHAGALRDLQRALHITDDGLWRAAAALATGLDAKDAFATGLGLSPGGAQLAQRLELAPSRSVRAAVLATAPPPVALGFVQLAESHGLRARVTIIARKLFPPAAFIRHWDPDAGRSRTALVRGYARRPFWLLRALPAGVSAWLSARHRVRQSALGDK